jgi:hypothetical protein
VGCTGNIESLRDKVTDNQGINNLSNRLRNGCTFRVGIS